jgi:hypothetical protein
MVHGQSVLRIRLDGEWLFSDFARIPAAYSRIYAFLAHVQSWYDLHRHLTAQWLPIREDNLELW